MNTMVSIISATLKATQENYLPPIGDSCCAWCGLGDSILIPPYHEYDGQHWICNYIFELPDHDIGESLVNH